MALFRYTRIYQAPITRNVTKGSSRIRAVQRVFLIAAVLGLYVGGHFALVRHAKDPALHKGTPLASAAQLKQVKVQVLQLDQHRK